MRALRIVLAAVAVAAALAPAAPASASVCELLPGFEERRFAGPGGGSWTACLPE